MECKIMGQILIDHAFSYALTATANLPVETPDNPYIELADLKFIQRILKIVGYEGIVNKSLKENYHSIKDDIPVVSVYTMGNVTVRGMLILDVPTIQPQPVESTQGTNRTPRATRTPTPTVKSVQKKRKSKTVAGESSTPRKSLKLLKHKRILLKFRRKDIEKMVDGEDEDSYASAFADSVFQDEEDTETRIKPGSHKENLKVIDDDDVDDNVDKEKKDGEKNDDDDDVDDDDEKEKKDEEKDDDDKNDDNDDHDDHALVKNKVSDPSMLQPTSSTSKILLGSVVELSRHHGHLWEQLTTTFITKEYFEEKQMPRMVNDSVKKDREIFADVVPELVSKEFATHAPKIIEELSKLHMKKKVLNVHPTASTPTAKTTANLKQQLYLKMKIDLQAQAADLQMWDVLKKKFKKSSASASSGKVHDAHQSK
ncbi:hypothetical protein Tco_0273330 [Tanacetum coccineum]